MKYFDGYCRFGYGDSEKRLKSISDYIHVANDVECYFECKMKSDCTAFAYESTKRNYKNCNLYRGGPYNTGNGRANTKCYVTGSCSYKVTYVVIFEINIAFRIYLF